LTRSGTLDGDTTRLSAARESTIASGPVERRYVETVAGELVRLGVPAPAAEAPPPADAGGLAIFDSAPPLALGAGVAAALVAAALAVNALSAPRGFPASIAGQYVYESTTIAP